MIRNTLEYYKRQFPGCPIIVYDNESTDGSPDIAKSLGAEVRTFSTGGKMVEHTLMDIRSQRWKDYTTPWVIVCDMDEFLCLNAKDLENEQNSGTTILKTAGYDIIADSKKEDLSDIDILELTKGVRDNTYSKLACFNREKVTDMNFGMGSHSSDPKGEIKYSEREYNLYHCKKLGIPYKIYADSRAFPRSHEDREKHKYQVHYKNTSNNAGKKELISEMDTLRSRTVDVPPLSSFLLPGSKNTGQKN